MTISTIALDLDEKQPPSEPSNTRQRRRGLRSGLRSGVRSGVRSEVRSVESSSVRSPRLVVDVDLTVSPATGRPHTLIERKENVLAELGTNTHIKQQVVLLSRETDLVDLVNISKLSRPTWPKSNPTIPSTLYKNDFQTKVRSVCHPLVSLYENVVGFWTN